MLPGRGRRRGLLGAPLLADLDGVDHAFETRHGSLDAALPGPLHRLQQVHGGGVAVVPERAAERRPFVEPVPENRPPADALVTTLPGVTVAVAVADCLPVLLADDGGRVVAAAHGGWRGLVAGILESTVDVMVDEAGCQPGDLLVAIGPAIGPCCFEVGPEVLEALADRGLGDVAPAPRPDGGDGNSHCDLAAVAVEQLRRHGVDPARVARADLCTRCHRTELWSYRADGDRAGRMLGGIALVA